MHIVKRIFGAIFLLGGLFCLVVGYSVFSDGNKHDGINFFGGGGAALLFSLVLFATSGKKKPWVPMQPPGYPQQPPQGYPQQAQGYPQQAQGYPQQQPPPGYAPPGYPPRRQ